MALFQDWQFGAGLVAGACPATGCPRATADGCAWETSSTFRRDNLDGSNTAIFRQDEKARG